MSETTISWLPVLLGLAAVLYGSVGHGGASSYIAVMALLGVPMETFKPAALCLNLVVAGIAWFHFAWGGWMVPRLTQWLLLGSIPAAMIGAQLEVSLGVGSWIIASALVCGAVRLLVVGEAEQVPFQPPSPAVAVLVGAGIGVLAGMAGIGGGVFLSPLLIMAHWASLRQASGICSVFIFSNSAAALLGRPSSLHHLPEHFSWWVVVVALGGWIGAYWGSQVFRVQAIRLALGIVLFLAAGKLCWSAWS